MQKLLMLAVISAWAGMCGLACLIVTGDRQTNIGLLTWLATCLSPFMLKGLALIMRQFSRQPFVSIRKKNRIHIHLNPWISTGNLTPTRLAWFWQGLAPVVTTAAQEHGTTVVITSHLLTPRRIRQLRNSLPADVCRVHVLRGSPDIAVTLALQLDVLFRQWRWILPSQPSNPILIIRRKSVQGYH